MGMPRPPAPPHPMRDDDNKVFMRNAQPFNTAPPDYPYYAAKKTDTSDAGETDLLMAFGLTQIF